MYSGRRGESISELQACTRTSTDQFGNTILQKASEMTTPSSTTKVRKSGTAQASTTPVARPTHDSIARRAYHIYVSTGSRQGSSRRNWLQAEKELRAESMAERLSPPDNNMWPLASMEVSSASVMRRN